MSNPVALSMIKSLIGQDQLAQMDQLVQALMKALVTIEDMSRRIQSIEEMLADYVSAELDDPSLSEDKQ